MEFRGDDRAVAVQIGAVLLLGFLVISLSMYQATVVPQENERVEFRHNARVVGDMQQVRNAVLQAAATGASAPTSVELGTNYPARSVFVNPSPPGGTLSTSSLGNVSIRNVAVDDTTTAGGEYRETGDFWNGTPRTYPTASLSYQPSYNRYQNAPTTVYENGLLYNRFDAGDGTNTVAVTDQSTVSGTRISLVTLSGDLSRGGAGTLSVDPQAVSQSTRTVSVTNNSSRPLSVTIPTRLSAEDWRELLRESGQLDEQEGGHVTEVIDHDGAVELLFEGGVTYELSMAKIRVGSGSSGTDAAYLTDVEGLDESLAPGESDSFVVEARDAYNNPVAAELVDSPGNERLDGPIAEEPGRYRYVYTAPGDAGNHTVRVSLDSVASGFDARAPEDVQFTVDVSDASGGDDSSGDDGSSDAGPNPDGETNAAVDDYHDQNNDQPFPPSNPVGTVSAFSQAQTDNNQYAQLTSNSNTLRVGTRTTNVKTDVSEYELAITYAYSNSNDKPVNVKIVAENGTVLQTESLQKRTSETTETISLDGDATNYVKSTGRLYVVYDNGGGGSGTNLRLYYQVVRTQ